MAFRPAPSVLAVRISLALASAAAGAPAALAACGPLPPPSGTVVRVTTDAELQAAVASLVSGTTILIADGTYDLSNTLHLRGGVSNVALRGESGDRDAVVLRGRGMREPLFGNVPHGVLVSDVTDLLIADLSIRDVWYHAIQVAGERGPARVTLRNLHLTDAGEQFVKGSTAGPPGPYADDVVVECSLVEYADRARSDYTNGVDFLAGARWVVRDNVFQRIRAPVGALAGPTVLAWRNSQDTVVERNVFLECDRGVALGLAAPDANARDGETTWDHQGGVVRNNFFHRAAGSPTGDVAYAVAYCRNFTVVHNTAVLEGSFPWAIEHRFAPSSGLVANNLTDGPILARDGSVATLAGNVLTAGPAWFVDAAAGDLHLAGPAVPAVDLAAAGVPATDDIDGDARPQGAASDVGADELFSCVLPPARFRALRAARDGADVVLSWEPWPSAPRSNVWWVEDPADAEQARVAGGPARRGVAACSEPDPAPAPTCRDAGAAVSPEPLRCYLVRATCGGAAEGP